MFRFPSIVCQFFLHVPVIQVQFVIVFRIAYHQQYNDQAAFNIELEIENSFLFAY